MSRLTYVFSRSLTAHYNINQGQTKDNNLGEMYSHDVSSMYGAPCLYFMVTLANYNMNTWRSLLYVVVAKITSLKNFDELRNQYFDFR